LIESWRDCRRYIADDLARHDVKAPLLRLPQARWQVRLRLTEWWCNTRGGTVGAVMRWRLQASAVKLGYTIPINRFGPGLKLPHWGTIVVSGSAEIGSGCQLHPGTLIGTRAGAPVIGRDVTIDSGAKIYGPIRIGDGCHIAPLAIVSKDVPAFTTVKGVNRHEPIVQVPQGVSA
jgi:serine O-acetyltransferase